MDSEDLLQCPYDKNHLIRPSRFPYHLVKCRENNPKAAKDVATCPYNARHRVPKQELQLHILNCLDKSLTENFQAINLNTEKQQPVHQSNWQAPPCQENWEDDDDCTLSTCPFILDQGRNSFLEEQKSFKRMEQTTNGLTARTSPPWNVKNSPQQPEAEFSAPIPFSPSKSENNFLPNSQKTKTEQKLNGPTDRVSPAGTTKPTHWKHDAAFSAPTRLNLNTSQNASLQSSQRAENSVTGRTSLAWMTKSNPWKPEAASSPPPFPQNISESHSFRDSQRNTTGLKANAVKGQTAPCWTTKSSPWKPGVGWSSHYHQSTSEAHLLDKDQWPTTKEQKSNDMVVQTCPSCGQNLNHRIEMGSSSSHHCHKKTSEHHGLKTDQRSTRMEQKSNSRISLTCDQKPTSWNTGFSSGPPSSVQGTFENESANIVKRLTPGGQTSNGMAGSSSSLTWGPKPNCWKTGSFK
ncbi:gametocyte-specific factor 1 isoform X1 [Pleurodeles waltl]|uniref:gametocyte-specific factor 1 isoform X1 n=1 Tax=Pleurodeles waltl TaxID=8319 RepID=UPI0037098930